LKGVDLGDAAADLAVIARTRDNRRSPVFATSAGDESIRSYGDNSRTRL